MRTIYSGVSFHGGTYLIDDHSNTVVVDCYGVGVFSEMHFAALRERMEWGDFDEIDDAVRFAFGGKP